MKSTFTKTNLKKYVPTDKELDELHAAIDFVSTNSDGADNIKPYQNMVKKMRSVWRKGIALRKLTNHPQGIKK